MIYLKVFVHLILSNIISFITYPDLTKMNCDYNMRKTYLLTFISFDTILYSKISNSKFG